MSSANIGWLFYKDYFNDIDYSDLENRENEKIIQKKVNNIINQTITLPKDDIQLGNTHFQATTAYPGLILGSGYTHELPNIEGQAILGFYFDYTTGLPTISGSSIKGVLRSAFKHSEYIKELLEKDDIDIKILESEIFDNKDLFFDAVIISEGRILGDDYLAPHGENKLKNPIPLRFIKVLPEVSFRFDFELHNGVISKKDKSTLFQKIIEDLGVGAKTNVGYGKFANFKVIKTQEDIEEEERELEEEREKKSREKAENIAKAEESKKAKEEEEKKKKLEFASQGIANIIQNVDKFKRLETLIKKINETKALDEEEKDILENHILTRMNDKIKRKKFPFGVFGSDKCFGNDRVNKIADKLGLK